MKTLKTSALSDLQTAYPSLDTLFKVESVIWVNQATALMELSNLNEMDKTSVQSEFDSIFSSLGITSAILGSIEFQRFESIYLAQLELG
jgi:hypothetical protein